MKALPRRRGAAVTLVLSLMLLSGLACWPVGRAAAPQTDAPSASAPAALLPALQVRCGGPLGLMGYNVTPDGSANVLQVNRSGGTATDGSPSLVLSQFGFGFTVSESVPLFLEIYAGYARYDPRALFTDQGTRRLPLRWNNLTLTTGLGYDIRLTEQLYLRPILNGAFGYATSDAGLFGNFVEYRTGRDVSALTDRHMNVYGLGGALTLAYYDYRPEREIDFELRYTQIHLQTFGDTVEAARGTAITRTAGAWGRVRWPTGWEAFGRPLRWVLDANASYYLGDQRDAIGFGWAVKAGGGIEFDIGRHEIGAFGINLNCVRLIGRFLYGDNRITGTTFGIGMSF